MGATREWALARATMVYMYIVPSDLCPYQRIVDKFSGDCFVRFTVSNPVYCTYSNGMYDPILRKKLAFHGFACLYME